MNKIRGRVVAVLLGVWAFPAVGSAMTPNEPAPISAPASPAPATAQSTEEARTGSLATREQQSQNLQDFKGGAVAVYVSSGVLLVAVIVLLVLLV